MIVQVFAQATNDLKLFINRKTVNGGLDDVAYTGFIDSNEAVEVHEREKAHDELAVHTVSDATVARNGLAEVLDLEGPLEARRKESTERSNQRSESGESQDVELNWLHPESLVQAKEVERVRLCREYGVWNALQTSQNIRAQVIDRAYEVLVADKQVSHEVAEANSANPRANKTLDGLLRGKLNELRSPKADTAYISKNVIGDDQRSREEEPDHALEDVVHDKVGLDNNQIQSHVRPGKLGELESVVSLLQRSNEEHESYRAELAEKKESSRITYP